MSSKDDFLKEGPVFEINPAEIDKNKNGLKPDNTDLKRTTKKTLKDYLSDKSSINQYPVDKNHDENKSDVSVYGDSEGKKSPELKLDLNEYQFKPQFLQKTQQIENLKQGKLLDNSTQFNGHNVIDQETGKPRQELSKHTENLLRSNRFNDENSYGSNIGNKTFSIKKYMKKSSEENNTILKLENSDKSPINLSVEQMNEIANYLMLRASGKSARPDTGELFIPGDQQLVPGTKVPGRKLNIQELVKDIFINDPNEKELMGNQIGQSRDSFGVLNNYFDRFEKTSVGTVALSAAIIGATIVAIAGVSLPLALTITKREEDLDYNKDKFEQNNKKHAGGTFKVGNVTKSYSKKEKPSDIIPSFEYFFGIERSRYIEDDRIYFGSFLAEIARGGQIFFSLNGNALSLLGSFGYYVNFCRSIIRDALRITDLFTPKNLEGQSVEFPDNIISYDTLQIVKNSKLIKSINLFIKLSDIEKSIEKNDTKFINDNNLSNDIKNFKRQSINYNHLKLSNLVINNVKIDGLIKDDKFKIIEDLKDRRDLQEEYILNSDLLPFYFKDLRTNKIVSFYATMSDFSETYSPQWNEEHFYGRVDPIKFYKSTSRKVSISFKVFSSGQEDYEIMWDKLQDLVSLVYPKYTDKRKVTIENQSVHIPYSQSYSQQPLVRVKVGELITNNISSEIKPTYDQFIEFGDNIISNNVTLDELFENNNQKFNGIRSNNLKAAIENRFKIIKEELNDPNEIETSNGNVLKYKTKQNLFEELINSLQYIKTEEFNEILTLEIYNYDNLYDKKYIKNNVLFEINRKKIITLSDLQLKPYSIYRYVKNYVDEYDNQIKKFEEKMKNNPFYKAMIKSYGLGALAYIDNLSYKTQEGYPWELDNSNGRRPKIIDVSMELTILHDVQPFSTENYKHYREIPHYKNNKAK